MFESFKIGLNGWGDLVMFHEDCQDTFAKDLQGKSLKDLAALALSHQCNQETLAFLASLRQTPKSNGDGNPTVA